MSIFRPRLRRHI